MKASDLLKDECGCRFLFASCCASFVPVKTKAYQNVYDVNDDVSMV